MRRFMCALVILGTAFLASVPAAWARAQKTPAVAQSGNASKPAAARAPRAVKARATPGAPVNLNAATVVQLQTLPGIGASTAQRILEYRQKFGTFKKAEELMNVKGIGEKSFLKLKPLITVGAEKTERAGAQK